MVKYSTCRFLGKDVGLVVDELETSWVVTSSSPLSGYQLNPFEVSWTLKVLVALYWLAGFNWLQLVEVS